MRVWKMQRRQLRRRQPACDGGWVPPVVAAAVRLIYCRWTKAAASSIATSAARPGSEAALKAPHSKSRHGSVVPLDDEEKSRGTPPSPPVELDEEKREPVPAD